MKRGSELGTTSVKRLVFELAVPAMIAQLVSVLYSIIDRMFIGNIPAIGETALAGVGVCGPIVTLFSSFGTLVGLGGSVLMAMSLGRQDEKRAREILANSFLMLLLFSAVLTVLFFLFKGDLLNFFGASKRTFPYANTYLSIYTSGAFFALLSTGLSFFITSQGYPKISMISVLLGAVTNIILDAIFIHVFSLGVQGAAWATVIAQLLSCIFILYFLFFKSPKIRITFKGYSLKLMRKITLFGISPFIIMATDSVLVIVMNAVLQLHGGQEQGDLLITCATIVQSSMLLITSPMAGITGGTQAILSYNYGAKNYQRVKDAEKFIVLMCLAFTGIMFVFCQLVPNVFAGIFTNSETYIALSAWGIRTFTFAIIPLSFQYAFVDGLTALSFVKHALCLSLTRKSLTVLLIVLFPIFMGAKAVFYAGPTADIISSIVSSIVFLSVFRKRITSKIA